jgi:hypothetical protein
MSKVIFSSVPPNLSPHLECTYPVRQPSKALPGHHMERVRLSGLYFSIFSSLCAEIRISGAKAFTGGLVFGRPAGSPG